MNDLISREWLKIAIHNFYRGLKHIPTEEDIQAYIDAAPSAQKIGHWIKRQGGALGYDCSCCGKSDISNYFDYCPNCGAYMRGEK